MIRPPLFGKDSSPQYTAPRVSAMGTAAFTVIFFLVMIFSPGPKPKQKYETVRIVLDTTPVEKVLENPGQPSSGAPEPAPQEIAEPAPAPAITETAPVQEIQTPEPAPAPKPAVKSESKPVQKSEPKTEPKPISKPKTEEPKYTKRPDTPLKPSVDDLMSEIANSRPNFVRDEPDWDSMFDDVQEQTPVATQTVKKVENALGGAAAKASDKTNERQSTSASNTSQTQTVADSKTSGNLKNIAATTFTNKTYNGTNSSMSMKTGTSSSGETSVSMNDGSNRILLKPREPKISIDSESAKNIYGEPTVTITFTVLPDGTVPESSVEVNPRSLLTNEIISDIAFQLSTWKFEPGTSKATASFDFTIKKR